MVKLGVVGTPNKENERRVPLHPDHLSLSRRTFAGNWLRNGARKEWCQVRTFE